MKINNVTRRSVIQKEFDKPLLILSICLALFGIAVIYSATRTTGSNSNVIMQSASLALGVAAMIVVGFFDYEQFKNIIKYIYLFAVVILIAVLFIGAKGDWGARSWIRVGALGLQPSELAKICFIITFSFHLSKVDDQINRPLILFGLLLHIAVLAGLIMLEPDLGSVLVFAFIFICLLFAAGISWKYIAGVFALSVISLPFIYQFGLSEYQQKRIQVFINPDLDPLYRGYNVIQSKIAVGSGGLWGKGFLHGTQNQLGYLPAKSTDFIFSVVSEEFGFIGAALVVAVLFVIIWRCFRVARKADNTFGKYICTAVGAMFLFHTFENVGMCMGLMPVTGIPLPFISYGGSSLVANFLAVGLVLSVNYHNKQRSVFDVY